MDWIQRLRDHPPHIAVVGDLMLDEYWMGESERISPEAPVPVVEVQSTLYRAGGAANVALNLKHLGAKVSVYGAIGEDPHGRRLLDVLSGEGLDLSSVVTLPERPTTRKIRVLARNQQMIRLDWETRTPLPDAATFTLLETFQRQKTHYHAVVFQDYAKGLLNDASIPLWKEAAKGLFRAVDPKPEHMDLFGGVEFLKPNWRELREWWGRETPGDGKELHAFLGDVRRMLHVSHLMVTRGAQGLWLHVGARLVHVPAVAREVYDVTGAGDTVLAAFVLAHLVLEDPVEAARFASVAAACEVGHLGATPVPLEEVEALYKETADRLMDQTRILEVDP